MILKNKIFEKFKDVHDGERVFLVANGPSLAKTDLSFLEGEVSIAMNRISLIYDKYPTWRPTYYLFSSTNVRNEVWGTSWLESVHKSMSCDETTSFIAKMFKPDIDPKGAYANTFWFDSMSEFKPSQDGLVSDRCFSTDVVERIDKSGTTMNLALQLAYHMGFSEVVFVGADLGWKLDKGSKSDPNHFDNSYRANISNPQKANNQMRNIHSLALKRFLERDKEVNFYNASLETILDVYPIIDYEEYIKNNKVVVLEEKNELAKMAWDHPPQFLV